jgi:hypothetical protein
VLFDEPFSFAAFNGRRGRRTFAGNVLLKLFDCRHWSKVSGCGWTNDVLWERISSNPLTVEAED